MPGARGAFCPPSWRCSFSLRTLSLGRPEAGDSGAGRLGAPWGEARLNPRILVPGRHWPQYWWEGEEVEWREMQPPERLEDAVTTWCTNKHCWQQRRSPPGFWLGMGITKHRGVPAYLRAEHAPRYPTALPSFCHYSLASRTGDGDDAGAGTELGLCRGREEGWRAAVTARDGGRCATEPRPPPGALCQGDGLWLPLLSPWFPALRRGKAPARPPCLVPRRAAPGFVR